MTLVLILLVVLLVTAGTFLMLSRNMVRFLFGLILIGNATNLGIFTAGGLGTVLPAFVPEGAAAPTAPVANALPQALILTAIVISFGLASFLLALALKAYRALGTVDVEGMRLAEGEEAVAEAAQEEPAPEPQPERTAA